MKHIFEEAHVDWSQLEQLLYLRMTRYQLIKNRELQPNKKYFML